MMINEVLGARIDSLVEYTEYRSKVLNLLDEQFDGDVDRLVHCLAQMIGGNNDTDRTRDTSQ